MNESATMHCSRERPRLYAAFAIPALVLVLAVLPTSINRIAVFAQEDDDTSSVDLYQDVDRALAASARLDVFGAPALALKRLRKTYESNRRSPRLLKALAEKYVDADAVTYNTYEAYRILNTLVEVSPDDPEAHYLLASAAFAETGKLTIWLTGEVKQRNPDRYADASEAYDFLIKVARDSLKKARELRKNWPQPLVLLAEIERRSSDTWLPSEPGFRDRHRQALTRSLNLLDAALEIDARHTGALRAKADIALLLNDQKLVLDTIEKLLNLMPRDYSLAEQEAQAALGVTPVDMESFLEALDFVVGEFDSQQNQITYSIAYRLYRLEQHLVHALGQGAPDVQRQFRLTVAGPVIERLRMIFRLQNEGARPSELMNLLSPYLATLPGEQRAEPDLVLPEFAHLAARIHEQIADHHVDNEAEQGEVEAALNQAFRYHLLARPCEDVVYDGAYLRALQHIHRDEAEAAIEALNHVAEAEPSDQSIPYLIECVPDLVAGKTTLPIFFYVIEARFTTMTSAERIRRMNVAAAQAPRWGLLHLWLGLESYQGGDVSRAREHLLVAFEERADDPNAAYWLARAWMQLANIDRAGEAIERAELLAPNDTSIADLAKMIDLVKAGKVTIENLNLYEQARSDGTPKNEKKRLLDLVMQRNPKVFEFVHERTEFAILVDDPQGAKRFATKTLELAESPREKIYAHRELGRALVMTGEFADAIGNLRKAMELADSLKGKGGWELPPTDRAHLHILVLSAFLIERDFASLHQEMLTLMGSGLPTRQFMADVNARRYVNEQDILPHQFAIAVKPGIERGQSIRYDVTRRLSGLGGVPEEEFQSNYSYQVDLALLETPEVSGLYVVELEISGVADDPEMAALEGRILNLEISPWLGLVNEVIKLDDKYYPYLEPLLLTVCEPFTIGVGTSEVARPFQWWNRLVESRVSFPDKERHEVCFVSRFDEISLLVKRLAIADFRDKFDPRKTWQPRKQIQASVDFDPLTRIPKEVTIKRELQQMYKDGEDVRVTFDSTSLVRSEK